MPLETQIIRDNKPLKINWGGFHVAAMVCAAAWDSGVGPWSENVPMFKYQSGEYEGKTGADYPDVPAPISPGNVFDLTNYLAIGATPMSHEGYELKNKHRFIDPTDGEIFELLPGDKLVAYRTMKG